MFYCYTEVHSALTFLRYSQTENDRGSAMRKRGDQQKRALFLFHPRGACSVRETECIQEVELVQDFHGAVEYPLKVNKPFFCPCVQSSYECLCMCARLHTRDARVTPFHACLHTHVYTQLYGVSLGKGRLKHSRWNRRVLSLSIRRCTSSCS